MAISFSYCLDTEESKKQLSLAENKLVHFSDLQNSIQTEREFESLFKAYYKALYAYALAILKDDIAAEEIVQNVFLKLWERREELLQKQSLKSYLYKCVYHDSLNHIRHMKVRDKFAEYTKQQNYLEVDAHEKATAKELEYKLRNALNELPQQCRTVFQMSRFQNLKYQEIAAALGISVKTVEVHMGKALKSLRLKLSDFLPMLICLAAYIKLIIVKLL